MPEETEKSPSESKKPSSLDQETLDRMLAESQGDLDQLESMLNNLEDNSESEASSEEGGQADLSELTDNREAVLDRMESDESGEDGDVSSMNDMLYQATLTDAAQSRGEESPSEENSESQNPSAPLKDPEEDEEEVVDGDLDSLLEGLEETGEVADEDDLSALLEDTEEDAQDADEDELDALLEDGVEEPSAESAEDDLDALLGDLEEDDEESEEDDLSALLEDAEEEAQDADEDELDALLEDGVEEPSAESAEDDLDALLGDLEEDDEESKADDLSALLEDAEEEAQDADEDELDALLENGVEEPSVESAEDDLDALLGDLEEEDEESEEDDLSALLEDAEEDAQDADEDELDALLEDGVEEPSAESAEDDLDALLGDLEEEDEESEEDDLSALLEDVEEDAQDADEDELDALLEDVVEEPSAESAEDDLDALLGDLEEEDEDSESEDLDALLEDGSADLDDLMDDFEPDEDLFNVGVEDEVAQILATGESLRGEAGILDEFKSVQESIGGVPGFSGEMQEATLLMVDADPDQRSMFEDALGGHYAFAESDSVAEATQTLNDERIDLILLSLDDDPAEALEFIEQVNSNLEMPSVPIIVTSKHTDRIEEAMRLGAVDYFTCPLDVMDIEFQVPQKVATQLKLQEANRILAGRGDASPYGSGASELDLEEDLEIDELLDDEFEQDGEDAPEDLLVRPSSRKPPLRPLSDQQKMLRQRKATRHDISRLPFFALILAFLVAGVGTVYQYSDEIKKWLPLESTKVVTSPPRPEQPLPKVKMPSVPQQNYASSAAPLKPPAKDNIYQRQADVLKSRIQQNVTALAKDGGAWWSPWRVMRSTGGSVGGLVDHQTVGNVLDAFGVDTSALNRGLQSQRTLAYLAGVGFDLRGKSAADLSAREAFELLSARQFKSADQIVDVLSKLTDHLAADRTAREEQNEKDRRKNKGTAVLVTPKDTVIATSKNQTVSFESLGSSPINRQVSMRKAGGLTVGVPPRSKPKWG
ncbi:MAG: hypothetical protein O3B73_08700 [bacterium]|nr:hypothetical protein [bacterium]